MPGEIGTTIIDFSTLIFTILLITGIVLWWPKNKSARKQRFKFAWKKSTSGKRKNYDLHNVLGFYASFIAIVIALTGLIWGFKFFESTIYSSLGGEKSLEWQEPVSLKSNELVVENNLDWVWNKMNQDYPNCYGMEIHVPETDSSSIYVFVQQTEGVYHDADYRFFDQYSLKFTRKIYFR